jgi:hypothetical protein
VIVGFNSFRKAIDDAARRDFQTAVEHFGKGWPAGAIELSQHGEDGRRALVYGVDPTGERKQESWPLPTLAALDHLIDKKDQIASHAEEKAILETDLDRSSAKIHEQLDIADLKDAKAAEAIHSLRDLFCIQKKLQQVTGKVPDDWPDIESRVKTHLVELPRC